MDSTSRDGAEAFPAHERHGVVGIVGQGERLLVIRRSCHVIAPGALCFPGGGIEPGETEPEALCREFQEELAVAVRPLRRIWENVTPWNVHLAWWTADLAPDAILVPNPSEVEAILWMTVDEMLAAPDLLQSNLPFLHAAREGHILLKSGSRASQGDRA